MLKQYDCIVTPATVGDVKRNCLNMNDRNRAGEQHEPHRYGDPHPRSSVTPTWVPIAVVFEAKRSKKTRRDAESVEPRVARAILADAQLRWSTTMAPWGSNLVRQHPKQTKKPIRTCFPMSVHQASWSRSNAQWYRLVGYARHWIVS